MVCVIVANCFGDRWSFLQVNGYMWVIAGLLARAWVMEKQTDTESLTGDSIAAEPELSPA